MPTYAAFLRGITPMNAKMSELKRSFEDAGMSHVRTVLASGNVVFETRTLARKTLERRLEAAMQGHLGRAFATSIRSLEELEALLTSNPFKDFRLAAGSKRVVTLLRARPSATPKLPIELDGARILRIQGTEILSAYVPSPRGPVFMTLIERTFGKDLTTRTWETIGKVVNAGCCTLC